MKTRIQFSLLIIALVMLLSSVIPTAFAQDANPPVDPNSSWAEVVNPDGSINYANLTDGGIVNQPADWMPNIPLIGSIPAEYHVYYTPSGNSIVMPTASTLMAVARSNLCRSEGACFSRPKSLLAVVETLRSAQGDILCFCQVTLLQPCLDPVLHGSQCKRIWLLKRCQHDGDKRAINGQFR